MDKLKVKAVIFDLGSTLIEYEKTPWPELSVECIAAVGDFLRKKGFEIPDKAEFHNLFEDVKADYRKLASENLIEWSIPQAAEKVLEKLNIEVEEKLIDQMFSAYYKPVDKNLYAYEDTKETLELLKEKIGTVGLVSNTIFPESAHLKELKRFELDSYFDFTIFSSSFGLRKPHPDIFYQAANFAGLAPSECVYIGDRYIEDVTGPNKIGMNSILKVLEKREYPEDMPEAKRRIENLSELVEHIEI